MRQSIFRFEVLLSLIEFSLFHFALQVFSVLFLLSIEIDLGRILAGVFARVLLHGGVSAWNHRGLHLQVLIERREVVRGRPR